MVLVSRLRERWSRDATSPQAVEIAAQKPVVADVPVPTPPPDASPESQRWPIPIPLAIASVVVLFFVSQILAVLVVQLAMASLGRALPQDNSQEAAIVQFCFVALAEIGVVGGVIVGLRRFKLSLRDLGLTKPKLADPVYAVVAFIIYFVSYAVLAAVLAQLIPALDVDQKQDVGFDGATGGLVVALTGVALVAMAPFAEEVLMRGLLFTTLRRRGARFVIAALVTSLIFAAAHLAGGEKGSSLLWIAGIDTFILSLTLCYLREKTGRLWAGIGVHALKNGVAFVLLFILHVNR